MAARPGSLSIPRSTNSTVPAKAPTRSCATATATVVLPMPPGPTMVTKRAPITRVDSATTSSSRPTIRARRPGRLACGKSAAGVACQVAAVGRPRDRRHEAIAAPRERGDVARAVLAVAQRLAQAGHVKPQAAFFDGDVGPDPSQQVPLVDDLVRAGHERNEDVEAARAQFHRGAVSREEPFDSRSG